jgi:hypothetical protein
MRIALPVIHATSDGAVGSFIAKLFAAKVRFSGSRCPTFAPTRSRRRLVGAICGRNCVRNDRAMPAKLVPHLVPG